MLDEIRFSLIQYRLEHARSCLDSAIREIEAGAFKSAANRSYYCIFHALRAVLVIDGFDSKKHSGIISTFQRNYIKTEIFPAEFSKLVRDSFSNRGKSDYEDFFVISKEETAKQIENAKTILSAVEVYIGKLK